MPPGHHSSERTPLLQQPPRQNHDEEEQDDRELLQLEEDDPENPRAWPRWRKFVNVAIIAGMALMSPLASSMFNPGIKEIADDFGVDETSVIATASGFVICLGIGPLVLAPLSETFGRRRIYIIAFSIFTLLQLPAALAPSIAVLIFVRTLAGFFGAVGIANGGGTISDMFDPSERATVFGVYLFQVLFGPAAGPIFGGIIVQRLGWRWIYWILLIVCGFNTLVGFFFLRETYAPAILALRKKEVEKKESSSSGKKYRIEGEDTRPLTRKLLSSFARPPRILAQPIVLIMSGYQALIFATTYSIFTSMQSIFSDKYGFSTEQVGLLYLAPGLGFLIAVAFLVPKIDTVYNRLSEKHGEPRPEFRLPLANIGSVLIPVGLFWFAWTVEYKVHWAVCMTGTFFYGIGQVMVFNTVQNYYIDSFEKFAASAIAAGALFRSLIGGIVPLVAPKLFDAVGYGWGISVFAFIGVALAPAPTIFWYYGPKIREKYRIDL